MRNRPNRHSPTTDRRPDGRGLILPFVAGIAVAALLGAMAPSAAIPGRDSSVFPDPQPHLGDVAQSTLVTRLAGAGLGAARQAAREALSAIPGTAISWIDPASGLRGHYRRLAVAAPQDGCRVLEQMLTDGVSTVADHAVLCRHDPAAELWQIHPQTADQPHS